MVFTGLQVFSRRVRHVYLLCKLRSASRWDSDSVSVCLSVSLALSLALSLSQFEYTVFVISDHQLLFEYIIYNRYVSKTLRAALISTRLKERW